MRLTEKARSKEDKLSAPVECGTLEGLLTDKVTQTKDDILEVFNRVIDDFKRVEQITNDRVKEIENFIKDQTQHNRFLRPFFSAE